MLDIKDFIDKSMNFGMGLAAYSRDKIEELVEELVRKGEVAQKDARQFASELVQKGEDQKSALKKLVHDEISAVLDKMDLMRKSDVQEQIQAALRQAGVTSPDSAAESKEGEQP